jgi:hypothetical protein
MALVMETASLDAAFRLVSLTLAILDVPNNPPETDETEWDELHGQCPDADPRALDDALDRAYRLQAVAVGLADRERGPRNDGSGPPVTAELLAEYCPGFSAESYRWAIHDGFLLTR